jgi:uncharacterized membrane protein
VSADFEATTSNWIHLVGICIEIFGVLIIVAGIVWSTYLCVNRLKDTRNYDQYKIRIGRSLLLGLEVLVAADIVKTIAIELTFTSLGLLGSRLIKSTIQGRRLCRQRQGSYAPTCHSVWRCA